MKLSNNQITPLKNVAIILVNWRGAYDTVECLRSLLLLEFSGNLHIVITDNCSGDASVEFICDFMRNAFPASQYRTAPIPEQLGRDIGAILTTGIADRVRVTLLCSNTNGGFAYGNNVAIAFADLCHPIDYYWILNNDTTVDSSALGALVGRMESDHSIGILGNTILYFHNRNLVQAFGGVKYSYITGRGKYIGGGTRYPPDDKELNAIASQEPTYVSGASMFVRSAYRHEVGLMSEAYFLYNEELDWSWRGRRRYRFAIEPRAVVFHKEGASIGTTTQSAVGSPFSEFFQARNKLMFAKTYTPVWVPTVFVVLALKCLRLFVRGYTDNADAVFRALIGTDKPLSKWTTKRST